MTVEVDKTQAIKARLKNWHWRINNLYYITDKKGRKVKFHMNDAQMTLFKGMHYRNIILKARQLGMTTFMMIFMLDAALFYENTKCAVIAHALDDAARLFREKIKFAYDNLPTDIKKAKPAKNDRTGELVFTNGSSITVGTSFRGGTLKYLHISEFGKICAKYPEKAKEIVTGAFEAVSKDCVITIESTAEGRQGYFFNYCQTAEADQLANRSLSKLDWKFFFFPWFKDDNYVLDEPVPIPDRLNTYFNELEFELGIEISPQRRWWYTSKEKTLGDDMKREYPSTPKEAFEQVIEGAYYAKQFKAIHEQGRITRVPHKPEALVHTFWDLGINDSMSIWFIQQIGREYHVIRYYENSGEGLPFYARVLNDFKESHEYQYGLHVAPHDIQHRELGTGLSRIEVAAKLGINFETAPKLLVNDGIEAVRSILPVCWFDEEKSEKGVNGLQNYRKEWDDKHGVWKNKPLHDENSHPADAFRTFGTALRIIEDRMGSSFGSNHYEVDDVDAQGFY